MFHAAVIEAAAGSTQSAAGYLAELDALNPRFSVLYQGEIEELRLALKDAER